MDIHISCIAGDSVGARLVGPYCGDKLVGFHVMYRRSMRCLDAADIAHWVLRCIAF